ncbi:MAG: alpha/beta fold hydrolase [Acidobacteriota bacterium]
MKHGRVMVAALALLLSQAAMAQTIMTTVAGRVLDSRNAAVHGAVVRLKNQDRGGEWRTTTDGEGKFRFSGIPPGNYLLTAKSSAFGSAERVVRVTAAASAAFDLTLEKKAREMPTPPPLVDLVLESDAPRVVKVFYASDRNPLPNVESRPHYGIKRNYGDLSYGVCEVSIPRDHRLGHIERPAVWRLNRENPAKHVVILKVSLQRREAFFTELAGRVAGGGKEALVFIHGYNVSFEQAAKRTAQLAYDLGFKGAPVFFSWPSMAMASRYFADEATIEWVIPHLKQFLEELARWSGAEKVHLIAHSMGNRLLMNVLKAIASEGDSLSPFREVIFAAPDVDFDVFGQVAPALVRDGRRLTLYASSEDRIVKVSTKVHRHQRAGQTDPVVVLPGIDTIDVSALDTGLAGHSYYGDNKSVISDLIRLIRFGKPPAERCGIVFKYRSGAGQYYAFSPEKAHPSDPRCEPVK